VLEEAGCQVEVARRSLCCGRPLYDYGMLDMAKQWLLETLRELRQQIAEEIPIVVLEPSCATVFRDEMRELVWGDEDANRLAGQVFLLSEFLDKKLKDYRAPALHRKALVHGHCHHKSVIKFKDEQKILDKTGLDYEVLDSGCCGMAGAFGYERGDHYEVSMACGERVLLPAVRGAQPETLIVADGFSCREQIEQTTGRRALHLSQVLRMGLDEQEGRAAPARYPENAFRERPARLSQGVLLAAGMLAGVAAAWWGVNYGSRSRTN
jgi:Fe-S oxidoreductase